MIFKSTFTAILLFSFSAFAAPSYTVQIVNNDIAQASLNTGGEPQYLQNGVALTADKVLFGTPYCLVFGTDFRPSPSEVYVVTKFANASAHNPPLYNLVMTLETHSTTPTANFKISCVGTSAVTIDDARTALTGIYLITEIQP